MGNQSIWLKSSNKTNNYYPSRKVLVAREWFLTDIGSFSSSIFLKSEEIFIDTQSSSAEEINICLTYKTEFKCRTEIEVKSPHNLLEIVAI